MAATERPTDSKELQAWFEAVLSDQRAALLSQMTALHEKALCELQARLEVPAIISDRSLLEQADEESPKERAKEATDHDDTDSMQIPSESPLELAELTRKEAALSANEQSSKQSFLQDLLYPSRLVKTTGFEILFCVFIVLNALSMAIESQFAGYVSGASLPYKGYGSAPKNELDATEDGLKAVGTVFGAIFLVELLIKLLGEKGSFWRSPWNYFDLLLTAMWILIDLCQVELPVEPGLFRLLRLLRLLRWLRLARKMSEFDALALMFTALRSSVSVMFWAFVMLGSLQVMLALIFFQVIQLWIRDDALPIEERIKLFEYFGNFTRSLLTMFEITLANWPPVARLLQESVSEWFVYFCVVHKCTMGFAVIGVINGVFMQETLKAARQDHTLMVREAEHNSKMHVKMMREFFHEAHTASVGGISKAEFEKALANPHVKAWFAAQDLSMNDVGRIFDIMSDHDVELSPENLSRGVSSLKGVAKSLDMHFLMSDQQAMKSDIAALLRQINLMNSRPIVMKRDRSHSEAFL
eukprot:TRINITY_DN7636_c0_g4_i1.p1 TRINITY_DN7636_c0_g4~~TRINITY_DN7636_c0_g4_i1.p1  ORF type:complete len:540 (+),score=86.57 TRINITY_DN7636_c0_g4_i1:40-1620(+)